MIEFISLQKENCM